jgi:hypothetical protein
LYCDRSAPAFNPVTAAPIDGDPSFIDAGPKSIAVFDGIYFLFPPLRGILAPLLRALFSAIATACFCGLPALLSILIFFPIVFRDVPDFNGI